MTLILAKDARLLVEQSASLMLQYLDDLGAVIEREAKLGKSFVLPISTIGLRFRTIYDVEHIQYHTSEMTPLQKLIAAELNKAGYTMKLDLQTVQIGGGLCSMGDDEVKHEKRSYIKISW